MRKKLVSHSPFCLELEKSKVLTTDLETRMREQEEQRVELEEMQRHAEESRRLAEEAALLEKEERERKEAEAQEAQEQLEAKAREMTERQEEARRMQEELEEARIKMEENQRALQEALSTPAHHHIQENNFEENDDGQDYGKCDKNIKERYLILFYLLLVHLCSRKCMLIVLKVLILFVAKYE